MNAQNATLVLMLGGVVLVSFTALVRQMPVYVWNASESVPIGLYGVHPTEQIVTHTLVAISPPERLARFLSDGGYLPSGVPLLKHVAALGGQTVCRKGSLVTVDGDAVGRAQEQDREGRSLPVWQGCRILATDEFFPMNAASNSLDGRYFGPLPLSAVIGRAEPLWTTNED